MATITDKLIDVTMWIHDKIMGIEHAPVDTGDGQVNIPHLTTRGIDTRDGGKANVIEIPTEFSASSQQIAGMYPFCVGTASPLVGTPLGQNLLTGQVLTGDPVSYYLKGLISAPAGMMMALNGRGKSSLVIRQCLGIADAGFYIMGVGDTKPDLAGMVQELGGRVVRVGPKLDTVNPLDAGPIWDKLPELVEYDRVHGTHHSEEVQEAVKMRRIGALQSLFRLSGEEKAQAVANDSSLLALAIDEATARCLAEQPPRQPLIEDVKDAVLMATPAMMSIAMTSSQDEYLEAAKPLIQALNIFGTNGPFGDVFAKQTSAPVRVGEHIDFDISAVRNMGNRNLLAAVQLACWSYGQAVIWAAHRLAELGLIEQHNYYLVLDEAWQFLSIDPQMIRYLNEYSRLNRTIGAAQMIVFHTPKDLNLSDPELSDITKGLLERSPFKVYGALVERDMPLLDEIVPLTKKEQATLVSWAPDGAMDPVTGRVSPPPGRGKFMLKALDGTGIPFQVRLTETEKRIHDTNAAWARAMDISQGSERL